MYQSIVKKENENREKRAGTKHTTNQKTGSKIITKDPSIIGLFKELKCVWLSFFKKIH